MTNLVKIFSKTFLGGRGGRGGGGGGGGRRRLLQPFVFGCQVRKFHHKEKPIGATKLQIVKKKKIKKKPKNQKLKIRK
jgi:hypothetical protein